MEARSNKNSRRQVSINGILQTAAIFLVFGSITAAIWALSHLTWTESVTLVVTTAVSLLLFLRLMRLRSQKNVRGIVLLDAGEFPQRGLYAVIATLSLLGGGMWVTAMIFESGSTLRSLHYLVFSVVPGTVFLIHARGRAEFCENGIWAYSALIPWSSIEAFQWKSSDEWKHSALWISYKNRLEAPASIKLDICENEKENIESLLNQYAPSATALHKQLLSPIDAGSVPQGR